MKGVSKLVDGDRLRRRLVSLAAHCQLAASTVKLSHKKKQLTRIANDLDISNMTISSGAGHDARYLHHICSTAMTFIPCKDGISHNEAETATKDDVVAGARVPTEAVAELADAD